MRTALKLVGTGNGDSYGEPVKRGLPASRTRIGSPPYGLTWHRGRLVVDIKEIENVRLMLEYRQQGLTYRAIAIKMNGLGKRTRSRTKWEHTVIRKAIIRFRDDPNKLEEVLTWDSDCLSK